MKLSRPIKINHNKLKLITEKRTKKVGIVPFYKDNNIIYYMIQLPKPKKHLNDKTIFGLARGTIDGSDGTDYKDKEIPNHAILEEPLLAALREGTEELGLQQENIKNIYDFGVLKYKNIQEYGIRFFATAINNKDNFTNINKLDDTIEIKWITSKQAKIMAKNGDFKPNYVPILELMEEKINERDRQPSKKRS